MIAIKMYLYFFTVCFWASQVVLVVKNLPANAGDNRVTVSIPGLGKFPEGGHSKESPCT